MVSELAAPDVPTEAGTLTVVCAEAPAAMVPTATGSGVAVSEPALTLVSVTLVAAVCPVLLIVSCTTTLVLVRLSTLVTIRLAGVAAAGLTEMVFDAFAVVKPLVLVGVKVTESGWFAPACSTVPADGL